MTVTPKKATSKGSSSAGKSGKAVIEHHKKESSGGKSRGKSGDIGKRTKKPQKPASLITAAGKSGVSAAAGPSKRGQKQREGKVLAKEDEFATNVEKIAVVDSDEEVSPQETKLVATNTAETAQKRTKKRRRDDELANLSPVVYIGHIPHGFYEDQMKGYFSQFGKIVHLKLSRNKKTAKSKHYAFIEFESVDVARIVAKATHNYILGEKILSCHVLPKEKVHPDLFKGTEKRFRSIPWRKLAREAINKPKNESVVLRRAKNLSRKDKSLKKRLVDMGIDYDFPGFGVGKATIPFENEGKEGKEDQRKRRRTEIAKESDEVKEAKETPSNEKKIENSSSVASKTATSTPKSAKKSDKRSAIVQKAETNRGNAKSPGRTNKKESSDENKVTVDDQGGSAIAKKTPKKNTPKKGRSVEKEDSTLESSGRNSGSEQNRGREKQRRSRSGKKASPSPVARRTRSAHA